jgi:hypothetical protein
VILFFVCIVVRAISIVLQGKIPSAEVRYHALLSFGAIQLTISSLKA